MVMHIPAQPGEKKVQLQVMNMKEARQPPWAWGALVEGLGCIKHWVSLGPHGLRLR